MTEPLVPPASLRLGMGPFDDPAVFAASGQETLDFLAELVGLLPSHRVLDLGCGCGRVAIPAMDFLDEAGSYVGLDVDPACVRWCSDNIQARDGRFLFHCIDVQSDSYNPKGSIPPHQASLPFRDGDFDRALVSSVFTHLSESGIERYLSELSRVVKSDGLLVASVFLMNKAAQAGIDAGATSFTFQGRLGDHSWALDPANPLDGVSVDEAWFQRLVSESGLTLERVVYGTWRDRLGWAIQQDWVVLRPNGETV